MKANKLVWITAAVITAGVIASLPGEKNVSVEEVHKNRVSESRELMATTIQVDICQDNDAQDLGPVFEQVWDRLKEIAWRMNVYDDASDVAKVNASYQHPVVIGADTWGVIQRALAYHVSTEGVFDITVRPLIVFWKKMAEENRWPAKEELEEIHAVIGSNKVKLLPENQIMILHPKAKIDLGGIAAGYAVDEVAGIIRSFGIKDFYIDLSGDIYVGGQNCEGRPWRIGVRDPRDKNKIIDIVELSNQALTTSGNYNQYVEIQGQRFSHIINPVTGYSQRGVISATVVSDTTIEADVLATALCILGPQRGLKIIENHRAGNAAMVIVEDEHGALEKITSPQYPMYKSERQ